MSKTTAVAILRRTAWAILPDELIRMDEIARGYGEDIEALSAKLGRPLTNSRDVRIRTNANGVTVAVIEVTGPIFRHANLFTEISGATALGELTTDFQKAGDDPSINTIMFVFDTPGGEAASIAELATYIRDCPKPVIGYVDNTCASAGYWFGSACASLYASSTAEIGSVGAVITARPSRDDGTIEIVSSQSPNKRLRPDTAEGRAAYQTRIDDLAEVFIADVADGRGVDVSKVLSDFGRGGMMIASKALAAGMIDGITTFEELLASLTLENSAHRASKVDASAMVDTGRTADPGTTASKHTSTETDTMSFWKLFGAKAKEGESDADAQARAERLSAAFGDAEDMKAFALEQFNAGRDVHEAVVALRESHSQAIQTLNDANVKLTNDLAEAKNAKDEADTKVTNLTAKVADLEKRPPLAMGQNPVGDPPAGATTSDEDKETIAACARAVSRA